MNLQAYILAFQCQAQTDMAVPAYKGSMVRGAFFGALRQDFCLDQRGRVCSDAMVRQACPVCALLATADEESRRGVEVARPCTVEPPLERNTIYRQGESFSFGITLFGDARSLLPYAVLGAHKMGDIGIGNRGYAPGKFAVLSIEASDPFSGAAQGIYKDSERMVRAPEPSVDHETILAASRKLGAPEAVTMELLTPMRLIADKGLVHQLSFPVFLRRLLRRLTDLTQTATGTHPGFDYMSLLQSAENIRMTEDRTRWMDVASYSSRQGRTTPIGGLIGEITFKGDLRPFIPWLLWGSCTHVGKDATKGGGWYRLQWQS